MDSSILPLLSHQQFLMFPVDLLVTVPGDQYSLMLFAASAPVFWLDLPGSSCLSLFFEIECIFKISCCLLFSISVCLFHSFMCVDLCYLCLLLRYQNHICIWTILKLLSIINYLKKYCLKYCFRCLKVNNTVLQLPSSICHCPKSHKSTTCNFILCTGDQCIVALYFIIFYYRLI